MRIKGALKIIKTAARKPGTLVQQAKEVTKMPKLPTPKTAKAENLRVVIWGLLAAGVIPAGLAPVLQAVADNPETLANTANLVVLIGNTLWWVWDRAIKGRG